MPKINKVEELHGLGGNIVLEMIEEAKETEAGIALPDSAKEKETVVMGKVVSVSELPSWMNSLDVFKFAPESLKMVDAMNLDIGDIVLCKKFDYYMVKVGDDSKEYRVYDVSSIIARVGEEKKDDEEEQN